MKETVHHEISLRGGAIETHQWILIPKPFVQVEDLFTSENLHMTGLLYFAYIDHIFSGMTKSHYIPPEAIVKLRFSQSVLLWFSGIWTSVTDSESVLMLELQKGKLVHEEHFGEGEFRFEYCLEERRRGDYLGFHIRLTDFYSSIRGDKYHNSRRNFLYHLTQGAVHRYVTVGFARRIGAVLRAPDIPLKKSFGIKDSMMEFWEESGQLPAGQTLLSLSG